MRAYESFETPDPIDLGQVFRDAAVHLRKVADAEAVEHELPSVAKDRQTVAALLDEFGDRIEAVISMQRSVRRLLAASLSREAA